MADRADPDQTETVRTGSTLLTDALTVLSLYVILFPSEYFGLLYGIMIISGGVFGFLQFAFFRWSEVYLDAPLHADICLLVLVLFSFVHPVYIWLKCWREERKFSIN